MPFTHDWFSTNIHCLVRWLAPLKGQPINALEIGCYEGKATCWLLENILTHPDACITAIDTFEGSQEHKELGIDFSYVRDNFVTNTEPWRQKVRLFTGYSADVVRHFTSPFHLVYIDGSHLAPDVLTDAVMAWPLVPTGGIVVFDDYAWDRNPNPLHNPRLGIDRFLELFDDQLEVIEISYQVAVRRR